MDEINFELAEKLGYKRPKSPFEKNIDSIRQISDKINKVDTIDYISSILGVVNQFEKTYFIYPNGNIEQYVANYSIAKLQGIKIENKIAYYYVSGINLYFICKVDYLNILEIGSVKPDSSNKDKIIIPDNYLEKIQKNHYLIDDYGNIIEDKKGKLKAENRYSLENVIKPNSKFYVDGKLELIQEYSVINNQITIVKIPNEINVSLKSGKYIYHQLEGTNRRYTKPDLFAGYIGVLFEMQDFIVTCTGSCFKDGSGYPSTTHFNGKAFDVQKKSDDPKVKLTDDELNLVKAFNNFHFGRLYTNKTCRDQLTNILTGMTIEVVPKHDDHLHFDKFDDSKIVRKRQIRLDELQLQKV